MYSTLRGEESGDGELPPAGRRGRGAYFKGGSPTEWVGVGRSGKERKERRRYWHADLERAGVGQGEGDGEHALWVRVKGICFTIRVNSATVGPTPVGGMHTRLRNRLGKGGKGLHESFASGDRRRLQREDQREMENNVGRKEVRQRRSEDLEVDGRGKALMKAMNRSGMCVVNGVKDKADYTYECRTGGSVIDLIWVPEATKAGVCEEWAEASCCIGDHALVAVEIQGYSEERVTKPRKEGWN